MRVFASAEGVPELCPSSQGGLSHIGRRLPGMSGIELHRHLLARRCKVPVIFITAHGSDERAKAEAASD